MMKNDKLFFEMTVKEQISEWPLRSSKESKEVLMELLMPLVTSKEGKAILDINVKEQSSK